MTSRVFVRSFASRSSASAAIRQGAAPSASASAHRGQRQHAMVRPKHHHPQDGAHLPRRVHQLRHRQAVLQVRVRARHSRQVGNRVQFLANVRGRMLVKLHRSDAPRQGRVRQLPVVGLRRRAVQRLFAQRVSGGDAAQDSEDRGRNVRARIAVSAARPVTASVTASAASPPAPACGRVRRAEAPVGGPSVRPGLQAGDVQRVHARGQGGGSSFGQRAGHRPHPRSLRVKRRHRSMLHRLHPRRSRAGALRLPVQGKDDRVWK